MSLSLVEVIEILSRTPSTASSSPRGLGASWLDANEGPDTWSPLQIVGHLAYGEEADWIPRAERILASGEEIPFDPFDRFAQDTATKLKYIQF